MANLTAKYAKWVHGKNPQFLIEEVTRWRIYETRYWMEECFALSAAELAGKAMELKYVAGTVAPNTRPTPFLCLVAKMLQIQPDMSIVLTFIQNEEFKYMRCLGMYYFRLVADQVDIWRTLEPYYTDFRKIKHQAADGSFRIMHIDEFVDSLLHEDRFMSMQLPRLSKRRIFEAQDLLEPRISPLEGEFQEMLENEDKYGKAGTSTSMEDTDSDLENKYSLKLDNMPKLKVQKKKKKKNQPKVSEFYEEDSDEEYRQRKAREKSMNEGNEKSSKSSKKSKSSKRADPENEDFSLGKMLKNYQKDKEEIYDRAVDLEIEDRKQGQKKKKLKQYYDQGSDGASSNEEMAEDADDINDRYQENRDKRIVEQRRQRKQAEQKERDRQTRREMMIQSRLEANKNEEDLVRREGEEEKEFAKKKETLLKRMAERKKHRMMQKQLEYEEKRAEKRAEKQKEWEAKQEARYGKRKYTFTHDVNITNDRRDFDDMK